MDIRELFHQHGLRCTRQRQLVYEHLASTTSHPTAEEVYSTIGAVSSGGLSLATVYNTLEALCSCGLANRLPAADGRGACRYDADTDRHVHLALPDGRVVDLPGEVAERLMDAVHEVVSTEDLKALLGDDAGEITVQLVAHKRHA